jgi:ketosteroid isomerase-like protein
MSQENVDVVRDIYAHWAQGRLRAGLELFDPGILFESFMPDDPNELVVAHGPEGITGFMREFLAQWENYRLLGDEFHEGGSKVVVVGRQTARGSLSGAEVESPMHSVWTFRGDRVIELRFTPSREEALEAAGLSE